MTESGDRSVNLRYLIIPVIIGLVPGLLCSLLFFLSQIGGSISETLAPVFALYLMFIMLYAYPPAFMAHFVGYEVLQSPSGAMISYPGTAVALIIVVCFYLLVGFLINRVFKVRLWRG